MRFAVYVPWVLSVLVALPGPAVMVRSLPDRLDPRRVLVVLTASMAALALAGSASLGLLVVAGTAELTASRMGWLARDAAKWELYELETRSEALRAIEIGRAGNLAMSLPQAFQTAPAPDRSMSSV